MTMANIPTSLLLLLLTTTAALTSPVTSPRTAASKRAGGPAIVPIPSSCTLTNPLPPNVTSGLQVSPCFSNASLVYGAYFSPPAGASQSAQAQQCFEQCYGYGAPGTCKSAVLAYSVPNTGPYANGDLVTACVMFGKFMEPGDFVAAEEGQWVNETATNIHC